MMLSVMQAADAAELRGDAREAVRIMAANLHGPDGEIFWRPERMRRLSQLVGLEGLLPRWATSRWILAQAAHHLDGTTRRLVGQAMRVAMRARPSLPAGASRQDREEHQIRIVDHDWVFRQVFLHDLGGLRHFLRDVAPPDLLAGADRIEEWAAAPLGAFRFLRSAAGLLSWEQLGTGETVETLDLGGATLMVPGECAIGRVVPTEEGAMFESAPLRVPEETALRVVAEPGRWVEAVAAAARQVDQDGVPACCTGGHDFGLTTDLPVVVQQLLLVAAATPPGDVPDVGGLDGEGMLRLAVDFVRSALGGDLVDVDGASPWPIVAESLLDNTVRDQVSLTLTPADRPRLEVLAEKLGGPAVAVCQMLADGLAEAA